MNKECHLIEKNEMNISIPQPCHEKWAEMTATAQGAFCKVCAKTVIDFTTMNDEEVKSYFINNTTQKTCGRFRQDQLTNHELDSILSSPMPLWKKIVAAVFILFGPLLSSSCSSNPTSDKAIEVQQVDTIKVDTPLMSASLTSSNPIFLPKPIPIFDTDTMYDDSMILGDVSFPEPIEPPIQDQVYESVMGAPVDVEMTIDSSGLKMDSVRTITKDSTTILK